MTRVGRLFQQARRKLGLRPVEVARRAGYKNINKGIRRITDIETGSDMFPKPAVYRRFIGLLGIDEWDVLQAMAEDFDELDQPVPPRLIVRLIPSFYIQHPLPEGCTTEEAIAIAERVAQERDLQVCVTLTGIRGLYIAPSGARHEGYGLPLNNLPFMESVRQLYPGHTFKEQLRLFRELAKTRIEAVDENNGSETSEQKE